jgi:hypothetical protein
VERRREKDRDREDAVWRRDSDCAGYFLILKAGDEWRVADGELNGVGPSCDDPADGVDEGEGGLLGVEKTSHRGCRGCYTRCRCI